MTVLLVDNDDVSRVLMQHTLERNGFDVMSADNGHTALEMLLAHEGPCIALVDPDTHGAEGLDICREVRSSSNNPSVYLILLSSREAIEDMVAGLDAGADDYLTKPWNPKELAARLRVGERSLKMHDSLLRQAHFDPLTKLPNRAFLNERLTACAKEARENPGYQFTLLFVDIDRFKMINDSLGHTAGDELMKRISQRLLQVVRTRKTFPVGDDRRRLGTGPSDMVARLSGDEFVVLLDHFADIEDGAQVADRIHSSLQKAFQVGGQEIFLSASIGISTSGGSTTDASEILRGADNAMYKAKLLGRARSEVNEPTGNTAAVNRLKLETDLRRALDNDEFEVHYQPIIDLSGCRITRFEALMRWRHPELGLIPPVSFIPLAEEIGLILPMGSALLRSACQQMQRWNSQFSNSVPATMCVNISPRQFIEGNLVRQVTDTLIETGLDPKLLELEVTENLTMKDAGLAGQVLQELSEAGIAVSLDDFGTGYSSLSYLLRLPIGTLKIDRSFVAGIEQSSESLSVVQTIIALGHNLGMKVIAEGIETAAQFSLLQMLKCDFGQGYLFSPALEPWKASEVFAKDRVDGPISGSRAIAQGLPATWVF
ncbi:MAG TPA: EAL domain-containing protein [Acidobacteriaceae bacterium]